MSLRKPPTLTPALLASNRRNAGKSTGPRTARGKAWSRLNRMRNGMRSPECVSFLRALLDAPPGYVQETAEALLGPKPVVHPLFREFAELCVQIEIGICNGQQWWREPGEQKKNSFFSVRSRNVIENKRQRNSKLQQTQQLIENKPVARTSGKLSLSCSKAMRYIGATSPWGRTRNVNCSKWGQTGDSLRQITCFRRVTRFPQSEALFCLSPTTNQQSPQSP